MVGLKFMSVTYLRLPRYTYRACGPYPKNHEKGIQRFIEKVATNQQLADKLHKSLKNQESNH